MNLDLRGLISLDSTAEFYIEYNQYGEEVALVYKKRDGRYKRWNITPKSGDTTATGYVKFESGPITDSYTPPS